MWIFDQTHTSINASTATAPGQQIQAAQVRHPGKQLDTSDILAHGE